MPSPRHSPHIPQFKQARPKRDAPKTSLIQLWVEHGSIISTRSAILLSKTLSAHSKARAELTSSSLSHLLTPIPKPRTKLPLAAPEPSALARRAELRRRRRQYTDAIRRLEARQREAEERREEERQAEATRVDQIRAEQQRKREQKAREEAEAAARRQVTPPPPAAVNAIPLANTKDAVAAAAAMQTKTNSLFAEAVKKPPEATQPSPATKPPEAKKPTTTASGFQFAMIAPGKPTNARGSDMIQVTEGMAEDLTRVIEIWNRLCTDAEPFRKDSSVKKARMDIKKQVNLMSNQIAASVKHVTMKVSNLCNVLSHAATVGGVSGEAFAMKEIAMRLVRESDGSISLNRTAAFAVGAVIVGVAAGVRDSEKMRDVFLGAFYQHCIYTLPAYGRRKKGEPIEGFRSRIGYKDGETPDGYMERSCGCISLFAAVVQTEHVVGQPWQNISNPFSLDIGWTWLARIANREQRTITPAITFAFLEVAGYSMSVKYRKQFTKLMAMVQQAVVINAVKGAPKGPTSRMDMLVQEFIAAGCVFSNPPEGRTLPDKDLEFL